MNYPNYYAPTQGLIWVHGEQEAINYPVQPNRTVDLWDTEEKVIYLKSADQTGRPSIQYLDYTIRNAPKDEIALLKEEIASLKEQFESMRKGRKKNEPVVSNDESE